MRMTTTMMDNNRKEALESKAPAISCKPRPLMRRPIFPPYGLRNPNFLSISKPSHKLP